MVEQRIVSATIIQSQKMNRHMRDKFKGLQAKYGEFLAESRSFH